MTVKQLREMLNRLDTSFDDADVKVTSPDYIYDLSANTIVNALALSDGYSRQTYPMFLLIAND